MKYEDPFLEMIGLQLVGMRNNPFLEMVGMRILS